MKKSNILKMKSSKKQGITLIALVITIIVLLILAGVTIATLTGDNGLLQKTTNAKEASGKAEIEEQLKLVYAEYEIGKYTNDSDIQTSLQNIYGEDTEAEIKNGILKARIKGKVYRYNSSTGKIEEYIDPFNYGTKTKKTVEFGDVITISKDGVTESFTVISNMNNKIVALPKYNITLTDHPVQSTTTDIISFSLSAFWTQESGWNDSSKVLDDSVNINMTEKNEDKTFKNRIQQYIDAYKETLEDMGAEEIEVRACTKPELDSGLGVGMQTQLTDTQKQGIRNPGRTGQYWICSGYPNNENNVWFVNSVGVFGNCGYWGGIGVRPVIEIY